MKAFRHAVLRPWDFFPHIRLCGNPGKKSVPAVMDRLFDSLSIGYTPGKIGKIDKKTSTFFKG
jgi:hypothetical protein